MLALIRPSALQETIDAQAEQIERMLQVDVAGALARLSPARRIWLVGTGTSQHAAELGDWLLRGSGRERHAVSSATFARFGPRLTGEDGVVVISHTGETAFARRCRLQALDAGARVVSITGQGAGWPEAIETVPRERSETYTVSYTAALVVLARLAAGLGANEVSAEDLRTLPDRVAAASAEPGLALDGIPRRLLVVVGVGPAAITAREGALKLREAARLPAEGYEAEYLLHGSAVPLGSDDVLVLLQPADDPDGLLPAIGSAALMSGVSLAEISEPDGLPVGLAQIPLTVRLQALASRCADQRGQDPDTVITSGWAQSSLWRVGGPDDASALALTDPGTV
jgi:glutamine---fructose-6-phosphate transaminase (isomerizing)